MASVVVSAEVLETRVLLSATSGTHLVFTVQPANQTAGTSLSVTVSVEDSSGSIVTSNDSTIRLMVHGPGRFDGDGHTMTATAESGVATFDNLTLDKAGTYTLEASIGHRHRVTSNSFVISADTNGADQLAFLRQTSRRGAINQPLRTVDVAVEDQFGNVIKTDDSTVTLSVESGPTTSFGSGTPSPYTETTTNGVAKFDNAILESAGTYTLSATDSNEAVTSAVSGSIVVVTHGGHDGDGRHFDNGFRHWY